MTQSKPLQPEAERPRMPTEYGVAAMEKSSLLSWEWATKRLANSHGHWIATTRPDGRPHVMLVWGVWMEGELWFSTSPQSRKGRNLARNGACVVCADSTNEVVIMEGVATEITDAQAVRQFERAYEAKYRDEVDTRQFHVYAVHPRVVFAFNSDPEKWAGTATRWRFPQT